MLRLALYRPNERRLNAIVHAIGSSNHPMHRFRRWVEWSVRLALSANLTFFPAPSYS
jgi:hypothetical protein